MAFISNPSIYALSLLHDSKKTQELSVSLSTFFSHVLTSLHPQPLNHTAAPTLHHKPHNDTHSSRQEPQTNASVMEMVAHLMLKSSHKRSVYSMNVQMSMT